jgi:hypothetical protein
VKKNTSSICIAERKYDLRAQRSAWSKRGLIGNNEVDAARADRVMRDEIYRIKLTGRIAGE